MSPDEILSNYERAFRSLLWRLRPRNLQRGVELLLNRARSLEQSPHELAASLQNSYLLIRRQLIEHLVRRRENSRLRPSPIASAGSQLQTSSERQTRAVLEAGIVNDPNSEAPDFHCDSGLGGLARWLRAAGYDARFWTYIDDSELIRLTMNSTAILLTTDSPMMQRSAITWGVVPALLVPLNVGKTAQFSFVADRLALPKKRPRCTTCGGQLANVDKHHVRDRIPPRTFPWLDEYYECQRCGKLFWPGTHWKNIVQQLRRD